MKALREPSSVEASGEAVEHSEGSHKDGLTKETFCAADLTGLVINGSGTPPPVLPDGALLERWENGVLQPIGHIAPPFFRAHPHAMWPDQIDVRITDRVAFGAERRNIRSSDITVGLELEVCFVDSDATTQVNAPTATRRGSLHPTTELFDTMLEVCTDADDEGIYSSCRAGVALHHAVNRYVADLASDSHLPYVAGVLPIGRMERERLSTHNEYLRRISIWLAERGNFECRGVVDQRIRDELLGRRPGENDEEHHDLTSLYSVLTFQPMICLPPPVDGDLLIDYVNHMNDGIHVFFSALTTNSPFWRGSFTGYEQFRQQLRLLYRTALRTPRLMKWNDGGRERAIKHLTSGEGINVGRAVVSDDVTCYSNSAFRLRTDTGGIEIAYLDTYPLPERRVAIAELHKALLLAINDHAATQQALPDDIFIRLDDADYYALSEAVARHGVDAQIDSASHGRVDVRRHIRKTLDWLTDHVVDGGHYERADWQRHVLDWLEPLVDEIDLRDVVGQRLVLEEYFTPGSRTSRHLTAGRAQIMRYRHHREEGWSDTESVRRTVEEFGQLFASTYCT